MENKFALLVVLLLGLFVAYCSLKNLNITEDSKVKRNVPNLYSNSTEEKDQVGSGSNMKVGNAIHESNFSRQKEPKQVSNVQEVKGEVNKDLKKKGGHGKLKGSDTVGPKHVPKEAANKEDLISSKPHEEEVCHGEECDLSNKCTDEQNKLVACLKVPGNEQG